MDRGDPEPVETTFELHLTSDETPREAGPVVAEHLGWEAITLDGPLEGFERSHCGRAGVDPSGQTKAGMVVEDVHDPDLGLVGEEEPGGVDLPQIVGRGPLETLGGGPGPSAPRCHQVVARERTMDRRDRRRTDPLSAQLG